MASGTLATGQFLFEIRLFGHDFRMAFKAGLMLEILVLVVHYKVEAGLAFLFLQIVMAAGCGAFFELFLAVNLVVAINAFDFGMAGMGKHDRFFGALDGNGVFGRLRLVGK